MQKYKIVGGKVYEAVQLTEHQFTGNSKLQDELNDRALDQSKEDAIVIKTNNNTFDRQSANLNNTLNRTVNIESYQNANENNFNIGCDIKV